MNEDLDDNLSNSFLQSRVYYAARDGLPLTIYSLLSSHKNEAETILNTLYEDDDNQMCTPLMIASKFGHDKVVMLLLSRWTQNLELEGTLKFDNFVIEGASALWVAAGAGHLNVVKSLVQAGADVNHGTKSQSTPLRAACYDGRLDVVQYLIEHNADIHKANRFHNTCLMIASYRGNYQIVRFLLEKGADPNTQAKCGASAMHFAVECGHVKITKELITFGATFCKNNNGMTPLLAAAERTRPEVVEYLITQPGFTKLEIIDALELLGASFANDRDNHSTEKAYHYLRMAMELRYSDPNDIISKPHYAEVPAYDNWRETKSLEELEHIEHSPNSLYMESLTIRERILGKKNSEVTHPIIFRGAVYADVSRFDRCILLWLHALDLRVDNNLSIVKDLLRFAQVFSQMIYVNVALEVAPVIQVLKAAVTQVRKTKELIDIGMEDLNQHYEDMESNLRTVLYILVVLTHLMDSDQVNDCEKQTIYQLVFQLNQTKATTKFNETLLHLVVNFRTPVDDFHTNNICKFPNAKVAKLIMQCGADVDAMDSRRNTPLHIIVSYHKPVREFMTLHSIIMDLVKYGAHLDPVNSKGETPYETASTGVAEIILKTQSNRPTTLKCIAAKVVKSFDLTYEGRVPVTLESFIEMHGSGVKKG